MPANLAARRGAANQRRKAIVAQKRKQEATGSGASALVRSAQRMPIQHCLLAREIWDVGMGVLLVARGETPYRLTLAMFLLDTFTLGVKDVFVRSLSDAEFTEYRRHMSMTTTLEPADPADARKLLHDLVAWSRMNGFPPHRDYEKIEPIFGSVDVGAGDRRYTFGFPEMDALEGKFCDIEADDLVIEG